ncbi:MAG: hypothetical protein GY754_00335 [bacterium]|nr:hypothetical protein [bacterium]
MMKTKVVPFETPCLISSNSGFDINCSSSTYAVNEKFSSMKEAFDRACEIFELVEGSRPHEFDVVYSAIPGLVHFRELNVFSGIKNISIESKFNAVSIDDIKKIDSLLAVPEVTFYWIRFDGDGDMSLSLEDDCIELSISSYSASVPFEERWVLIKKVLEHLLAVTSRNELTKIPASLKKEFQEKKITGGACYGGDPDIIKLDSFEIIVMGKDTEGPLNLKFDKNFAYDIIDFVKNNPLFPVDISAFSLLASGETEYLEKVAEDIMSPVIFSSSYDNILPAEKVLNIFDKMIPQDSLYIGFPAPQFGCSQLWSENEFNLTNENGEPQIMIDISNHIDDGDEIPERIEEKAGTSLKYVVD